MSDTGTGLASNDVTYETHVTDERLAPEPEPESEKQKPEQPEAEAKAEAEPERAPISWLRLAAAEIEAKKGNPNPGRTRQSIGLSPSVHHSRTMSESTIGKLNQKDYTPEVDELLPQTTSLAQVRFPQLHTKVHVLTLHCFTLGWPAPGGTGEAPRARETSTKRSFPISSRLFSCI